MRRPLILWLALGWSVAAPAVEEITLTQNFRQPWSKGEWVCLVRNAKILACGPIKASNAVTAKLELALEPGNHYRATDVLERPEGDSVVLEVLPTDKSVRIGQRKRKWVSGDVVCLYRKRDLIACAEVAESRDEHARAEVFWAGGVSVSTWDVVREAPGRARVLSYELDQTTVTIAQPRIRLWQKGESVAILHKGNPVAWGEITSVGLGTAELKLLSQESTFDEGDWVRPAPPPPGVKPGETGRGTASLATETAGVLDRHNELLSVGLASLFPVVRYERLLLTRLSVGLLPLYLFQSEGAGSLKGFGALITASYYPRGSLRHLWFQMGVGLAKLSADGVPVPESFATPAFLSTLGWRWSWSSGLNVGLAGGALNLLRTAPLNTSGMFPILAVDLGLAF